jgi:hypothetical protein
MKQTLQIIIFGVLVVAVVGGFAGYWWSGRADAKREAQTLECQSKLLRIGVRMDAVQEEMTKAAVAAGSLGVFKPSMKDLYSKKNQPVCPAGGQYEILDGFTKPKCSVHGFNLYDPHKID